MWLDCVSAKECFVNVFACMRYACNLNEVLRVLQQVNRMLFVMQFFARAHGAWTELGFTTRCGNCTFSV